MRKTARCLTAVLLLLLLGGCSKVVYYFNDAVSFRLENGSGVSLYAAAVSFGTEETVFGSVSGENADGTPLADRGKECLVLPVEEGDLNGAELGEMVFAFSVRTRKNGEDIPVGSVRVTSPKPHRTYTVTVTEEDGRLALKDGGTELAVLPAE